jgi:hypothetical protein
VEVGLNADLSEKVLVLVLVLVHLHLHLHLYLLPHFCTAYLPT